MNEMNFLVSDAAERICNLKYIIDTTFDCLKRLKGDYLIDIRADRAQLSVSVPKEYAEIYSQILLDKIADVIAVNYKYAFFKKYVRTGGVTDTEYEMLIASLIAADLDEDKRYIINGKPSLNDFTVDGYFNFRLRPLKEKWAEIVTYIPTYFSTEKLEDFITFIVSEKKGKRAIVKFGKVYDERFNRMLKGRLVGDVAEGNITREIILSGFSEVELDGRLPKSDEKYLIRFFGDKIFFKKEKIT